MLRVTLLGNLGADPEVRYTQKGTQMVSFRVAVNQVRSGPDGERQENTEWFRIRVTNRQAEFAQRLTRGTRVLVVGRLDISHYQSKDGEPRTGFDVWADDIQSMTARPTGVDNESMLDGEADGPEPAAAGVSSLSAAAGARPSANGTRTRATSRAESPPGAGKGEDLEDLPF
jgi:single-strand DNA-binding protein